MLRARSLLVLVLFAYVSFAQQLPSPQLPTAQPSEPPEAPAHRKMMHEMRQRQNKDRQEKIEADTQKIAQLSSDLKQRVTAGETGQAVANEAEQIKKLAKRIESNMRGELNAITPNM